MTAVSRAALKAQKMADMLAGSLDVMTVVVKAWRKGSQMAVGLVGMKVVRSE